MSRSGSCVTDDTNSNGNGPNTRTREGVRARLNELGQDKYAPLRAVLNELGQGKYAPLFEFHEVNEKMLQFLTLEDLKDIGITEVGPRKKIYSYIQSLKP